MKVLGVSCCVDEKENCLMYFGFGYGMDFNGCLVELLIVIDFLFDFVIFFVDVLLLRGFFLRLIWVVFFMSIDLVCVCK